MAEVCPENGQLVEYGEPLFRVDAGMRRVFIPNRGEIAVRIVGACRPLGLECVVGASDADLDGVAARIADRVVCIGPGPAVDSYLRDDVVVQAALGTGCDAIHPGYGFLSESPRLAARAREHGLMFVGPPTEAIELAGDKLAARARRQRAGVPVLPGGEVSDAAEARRLADEIGYPLLIKAAGGGGGRGIKRVHDDDELGAVLGFARSEAGSAFGDDRVYLEKLIESARHVEVQIAADEHGSTLHLGERDCSVQRRFQKVVEEAPPLGLRGEHPGHSAFRGRELCPRHRLPQPRHGGVRRSTPTAVSPTSWRSTAGSRSSTRSPRRVTGLDLVAMQLAIAAGEPLRVTQDQVPPVGHAIECRLNAEDPARGFMPSPGRLSLFSVPERDGLRVDTHCRAGRVGAAVLRLVAGQADRPRR